MNEVLKALKAFDERIMDLLADYYDPLCNDRYKAIIRDRICEDVHMAESLGAIDFDDYDKIMCIIMFLGTEFTMEERLW